MSETGSSLDTLFATSGGFIEADYLGFLAQRVPKDIAAQLFDDGQPDIGMQSETVDVADLARPQTVDVADLVRPLSARAFPTEKLLEAALLLDEIAIGYEIGLDDGSKDDPYKVIYAASLLLYCRTYAAWVSEGMAYMRALRVVATVSLKLDFESRLQVSRFLGSLVPMLPSGSAEEDQEDAPLSSLLLTPSFEDAPLSSLLLTLSVIVGSVVSDLSIFAERTMKSERIEQAWSGRFDEQAWSRTEEENELLQSEEWTQAWQEQFAPLREILRDDPVLLQKLSEPWNTSREEAEEVWKAVYQRIAAMKQMLLEMYGAAGKVRQGADRFLLAVAEGANHGSEEA